jgi:hypothetical protein
MNHIKTYIVMQLFSMCLLSGVFGINLYRKDTFFMLITFNLIIFNFWVFIQELKAL